MKDKAEVEIYKNCPICGEKLYDNYTHLIERINKEVQTTTICVICGRRAWRYLNKRTSGIIYREKYTQPIRLTKKSSMDRIYRLETALKMIQLSTILEKLAPNGLISERDFNKISDYLLRRDFKKMGATEVEWTNLETRWLFKEDKIPSVVNELKEYLQFNK